MNLQEFLESKYCVSFIDKFSELKKSKLLSDKYENDRKRFRILNNLVNDLFRFKNSRESYQTISNLIVTILLSFEENTPIDIYSSKKNISVNKKLQEILKEESKHMVGTNGRIFTKGRVFLQILERFLKQYEYVYNVFFRPVN